MNKSTWEKTPWKVDQFFKREDLKIKKLIKPASLYLYNINTEEEIELKLIPDNLSETYNPRIVSASPFGIVRPLNFYVGGENKRIAFSLQLHEDYIGSSLYDFLEKLRRMSMPVTKRNLMLAPLVYFQLGEQFAGKGHISTSFELSTPFRNGRYISATCSFEFIFHEEYAGEVIDLSDIKVEDYSSRFTSDRVVEGFDSYEDFILITHSEAYFIKTVFDKVKVSKFIDRVELSLVNSGEGIDSARRADINSLRSGHFVGYSDGFPLDEDAGFKELTQYWNPYGIRLINLVVSVKTIVNPIFNTATILNNLSKAGKDTLSLAQDFNSSRINIPWNSLYENLGFKEEDFKKIGWYKDFNLVAEGVAPGLVQGWRRASDGEVEAFWETIEFLIELIDNLKTAYSSLTGAGD